MCRKRTLIRKGKNKKNEFYKKVDEKYLVGNIS